MRVQELSKSNDKVQYVAICSSISKETIIRVEMVEDFSFFK